MANPSDWDAMVAATQAKPPAPKQSGSFLDQAGKMIGDVAGGVSDLVTHPIETAASVAQGAGKAVDETLDAASQIGAGGAKLVKDQLSPEDQAAVTRTFAPAANAFRKWGLVSDDYGFGPNISDGLKAAGIETPNEAPYQFAEKAAEFTTGFIGAGKVLRAVQPLSKAGAIAKTATEAGMSGFFAMDPHEDRLANLIRDNTPLKGPILDFMAHNGDEPALAGRVKSAMENAGLGALGDTLLWSLKGIKFLRNGATAEAIDASDKAHAAAKQIGPTMEAQQAAQAASPEVADAANTAAARPALPAPETVTKPADAAEAVTPEAEAVTKPANPDNLPAEVQAPAAETPPTETANLPANSEDVADRPTGAQPPPGDKRIYVDKASAQRVLQGMIDEAQGVKGAGNYNPAADLNWDKIDGPEGMKAAMRSLSDTYEDAYKAARGGDPETGVLSIADTEKQGRALAKEMGVSAQSLYEGLGKGVDDAQQLPARVAAARQLHVASLDNFTASVEAYVQNPGNETIGTMIRSMEQVANVQASIKSLSSNAARSLRLLRETVKPNENTALRLAQIEDPRIVNMLDPTGQSSNAAEALNKMAGRVNAANGKGAAGRTRVLKTLQPSLFQKIGRVTNAAAISNMLSSPGTHAVNLTGGIVQNIVMPTDRFLGGLATADLPTAREGVDQLIQAFASLPEAFRIAGKSTWRGQSQLEGNLRPTGASGEAQSLGGVSADDLGVQDGTLTAHLLNGLNGYSGVVQRGLMFGDELNRQIAFRGRVQASALRAGRESGLTGDSLDNYMKQRLDDATDGDGRAYTVRDVAQLQQQLAQVDPAKDPMLAKTLQGQLDDAQRGANGNDVAQQSIFAEPLKPGELSYWMQKAINSIPLGRVLIAPFIKTPTNIVRWAVKRTPGVNLAMKEVRDDLGGLRGPEFQKIAVGRMVTGTGLYSMGIGLAANGNITGAGPNNPNVLKAMKAKGWQPFSIKIGDQYYTYNRLDPVAAPLSSAATVYEKFVAGDHSDDESKYSDYALHAITGFAAGLKDKTYLQGVSDLIDLMQQDDETKDQSNWNRWLGQKMGIAIPAIVANTMNTDDTKRVAHTPQEVFERRAPGLSQNLDPDRNWIGEEIAKPTPWPNALFGGSTVTKDEDPLQDELARLAIATGSAPTKPAKKQFGVDLTQLQSPVSDKSLYDRWQELTSTIPGKSGLPLRDALTSLTTSPKYKLDLTDGVPGINGTRQSEIGKVMTEHRRAAWKQLVAESPELDQAVNLFNARKTLVRKTPGSNPLPETDTSAQGYTDLLQSFRQ